MAVIAAHQAQVVKEKLQGGIVLRDSMEGRQSETSFFLPTRNETFHLPHTHSMSQDSYDMLGPPFSIVTTLCDTMKPLSATMHL